MRLIITLFITTSLTISCATHNGPQAKDHTGPTYLEKKSKHSSGWKYKGERDKCFYQAKQQCFETKAEACKHAGCEADCLTKGNGPSKVSCPN